MPVKEEGFADTFFADDLNCYKSYAKSCSNAVVYEELGECQRELHDWGGANQVQFDAAKEHFHVLDRWEPEGEGFGLLGVEFEENLAMEREVQELADRCHWKLRALLRSKRFFTEGQVVQQYKTHILPFVEHSTPAVHHGSSTLLDGLDRIQRTLLKRLDLTEEEALKKYHLAPLSVRRDVAMLGVVRRTVLNKGPVHFKRWFFPAERAHTFPTRLQGAKHGRQLHDYLDGTHSALLRRSALGLPRVYNSLPAEVVGLQTVKEFQRALQTLVREAVQRGDENWRTCLSPRGTKAVRFANC